MLFGEINVATTFLKDRVTHLDSTRLDVGTVSQIKLHCFNWQVSSPCPLQLTFHQLNDFIDKVAFLNPFTEPGQKDKLFTSLREEQKTAKVIALFVVVCTLANLSQSINIYISIYIYQCLCVCVNICKHISNESKPLTFLFGCDRCIGARNKSYLEKPLKIGPKRKAENG